MKKGKLEIRDLSFRDRGPYALIIEAGECVGLQGASGAGKTLLLRAVADLDPHLGTVALGGLYSTDVPAHVWRRTVALLQAESFWWKDTVAEHFQDFSGIDRDQLESLGFTQETGNWQVSRLSTGEKQRLAILRILENRPGALLLDEPTASLDAENIRNVEELLLGYGRKQGIPMLWVSHDPDQLNRVADRIFFMNAQGDLLETGEEDGC